MCDNVRKNVNYKDLSPRSSSGSPLTSTVEMHAPCNVQGGRSSIAPEVGSAGAMECVSVHGACTSIAPVAARTPIAGSGGAGSGRGGAGSGRA